MLNSRLGDQEGYGGRVIADADLVIAAGRKYHEYYIVETDLASAVYGICAHNIAVYYGSHYNAEAKIDRMREDNE